MDKTTYKFAAGVALWASFILIWLSLGVGIIGADGDPANRMYFGVLAIGIVGAIIARFQAPGMAHALIAMAVAQTLVALFATLTGMGLPWSGPLELILLNGFFVALFLASAWLFRRAAMGTSPKVGANPAVNDIPFPDLLANAIHYWERGRLLYNGVLALIVAFYFIAAWPVSKAAITVDHSLQLFLQAVLANVLYCAAYPVDVFAQLSSVRSLWLNYRWVLFAIGLTFAGIIARFISLELFQATT